MQALFLFFFCTQELDPWHEGHLTLKNDLYRGLCASRFSNGEVGRVRHVGRWFPEIGFRSFAQDLATPSARSFAHRIPHEMIKASFMREALRHLPLENQMSHASHTSHPQAESKARSSHHHQQPTKTNKKGNNQMKLTNPRSRKSEPDW